MNKPTLRLFATAVIATASAASMWADTVTINPTNNGYSAHGSGALTTSPLKVKNTGNEERTFLKFHLPDASIPAGSTITSVTFKLRTTTAPATTETYSVHNSTTGTHSADWTEASSINWFNDVPPDQLLATASTVAAGSDVVWTSTALKDATVIAILGDMTLIVTDPANGAPKEGVYEDRGMADPPRLTIVYTPPSPGPCSAAPLTITRDSYAGTNPLDFGVTGKFTISFTITAGCDEVTGIKAQGGIAANQVTTYWGTCPGSVPCPDVRGTYVGSLTLKNPPGKSNGNIVFTWNNFSLPAGASATFSTDTYVTFNPSGNMICDEIKSLTGGWTVSGKANGVSVSDGPTGPLEVEVICL